MNNDLISREAALEKIGEYYKNTDINGEEQFGVLQCSVMIRELPTVDAEPVRHGRWEENEDKDSWFRDVVFCSRCGIGNAARRGAYCPNCGAKMDLEETR